ncbi:MAG: efflux RND transporter permease subunit, partial [Candidatus Omnitrophica bacterium]|nr:efflux RND transporter permease subunit [Candidatus Omnitrophota bacterium]
IIGKFFFQFGITISAAVALSLLEALTLAPMRCSQFLDVATTHRGITGWVEKAMEYSKNVYAKLLVFCLDHKWLVFLISIVFFVLSLASLPRIRKEFVPAQDQSMFLCRIKTPIGSSLEFTSERMKEVEKIAMQRPEFKRYYAAVGGFGGGEVNSGMLFVTLKAPRDRPRDPETGKRWTQEEIMAYYRREFNQVPDVKAVIQDLSMRGFAAQRGFPIEFTIRGPNWDRLVELADQIEAEMRKSDLFQDVDTDYQSGMPELRVYPDRDLAFARGVSINSIASAINAMIGGERVAKYTESGRRYDVRVQVVKEQRARAEDIQKLVVWNNRGEMVRLSDVTRIEEKPSLLAITRKGRERAIGIFANIGRGKSQADSLKKAEEIAKAILPEGYRLVFSGTSQTFRESFESLIFALWLGIVVAFMVLASQFNHLIHPVTVLLALPFSLSGAFLSLALSGFSLNVFSMIGLILLMGIVKKNSILLVEFTNQMRERGLGVREALLTACPIRLRPIIMTTVSTIAAAIPPALAMGPGAETRIPMAISVIGGVTVSTLLTLFVVPAAYLAFSRFEKHETRPPAGE